MRIIMSLVIVASLAGTANAQWVDACPENNVDGIEIALRATVDGKPANDEGVSSQVYLQTPPTPGLYGSQSNYVSIFSNGFLSFRWYNATTIGSTGANTNLPNPDDEIHHMVAPFWTDLINVQVCVLNTAERFIVQWNGETATTLQIVQFQASVGADGVIRLEYGPEHDPEAAELATIGIEKVWHGNAVVFGHLDPTAAEPLTGYSLVPNAPQWPDDYEGDHYYLEGYEHTEDICDDDLDNDGDGLEDCSDPDCEGSDACVTSLSLAAGWRHTCVTTDDGGVRCWGDNRYGQLGYGNEERIGDDETPAETELVDVGGPVSQLVAGAYHNCALMESGAVRCWGRNKHGELGYGHKTRVGDNETPASVGDVDLGGNAVQLAAGKYHTCALLDTGTVRCWGRAKEGQLGYGNRSRVGDNENPAAAGDVSLSGIATQVVAGKYHTCALLTTGEAQCWGWGKWGQLGYGNTENIGDDELPSAQGVGVVPVGGTVIELAAGWNNTCAILDDGAVRCWGKNRRGELGYGNCDPVGDNELPSDVGDIAIGGGVVHVQTGRHTCAILDTGALRCFGKNKSGQLGYGHNDDIGDDELPYEAGDVPVGGAVTHLAIGRSHTCVFIDTGALRCFGNNRKGQLGYGHEEPIGDDEPAAAGGDVDFQ